VARYLIVGSSGSVGRSLSKALGADALSTHCHTPTSGSVHFDILTMSLSEVLSREDGSITHAFLLQGETGMNRGHAA